MPVSSLECEQSALLRLVEGILSAKRPPVPARQKGAEPSRA